MFVGTKASAARHAPHIPVPEGPCNVLDVGGGHGYFSVELCRLPPQMGAVVFDLPRALEASQEFFDQESADLGGRVTRQAGNVNTDGLGDELYDLVIFRTLAHVLSAEQNESLVQKCARSLRPGGSLI